MDLRLSFIYSLLWSRIMLNTLYLIAICFAVGFGGGFGTASYFDKLEIQSKNNAISEIKVKSEAELKLATSEVKAQEASALALKQHLDETGAQNAIIISDYADWVRVYTADNHRDCKTSRTTVPVSGKVVQTKPAPEPANPGTECLKLTPAILDAIDTAKQGVEFAVAKCGSSMK